MDHCAQRVSVCCFSSLYPCSPVSSRCLQPVCARLPCHLSHSYLWTVGGSRRKLEGARKGGVIGCSFSLVFWHIWKEEVSSPLVLQQQLQRAWVTGSCWVSDCNSSKQPPPPPQPAGSMALSSVNSTSFLGMVAAS